MHSEHLIEKRKQLARLDNNFRPQKLTRGSVFSSLALCDIHTVRYRPNYVEKHFFQEFISIFHRECNTIKDRKFPAM